MRDNIKLEVILVSLSGFSAGVVLSVVLLTLVSHLCK